MGGVCAPCAAARDGSASDPEAPLHPPTPSGDRPDDGRPAAPAVRAGFLDFPASFVFGAATAAYQIEGGAAEGGRGPCIWDDVTHLGLARRLDMHTGDVACDHYHRFRDDVALMARLGLQAYRFSISWSRLIPDGEGEVNEDGVRFYSDLLDALAERGIEPWVTLYHWDLPSALNSGFGGWLGPKERIVAAFGRYARLCFERFGDRVRRWVTLNEPFVMATFYMVGVGWPSRRKGSSVDPYTAAHGMLLSHAEAARIYRTDFQASQGGLIGMTLNSDFVVPSDPSSEADRKAAQQANDFQLGWFADPIYFGDYPESMRSSCGSRLPVFTAEESELLKGSSDFFGVNNYFATHASLAPTTMSARTWWKLKSRLGNAQGSFHADRGVDIWEDPHWERVQPGTGWPIVPWGLRDLLLYVQQRYSPPGGIAILENGCSHETDESSASDRADKAMLAPQPYASAGKLPPDEDWDVETFDDPRRVRYLQAHLSAVHAAIAGGADVRAYFAWSLLDNFEWMSGYRIRFGIVRVDYRTQKRTVKASGRFYAKVIKDRAMLAPPRSEQYRGKTW